jgi:cytochrome c oxidase subunit 3
VKSKTTTPSAESHGAAAAHGRPWYLAHHFDDIETQNHAVRLGMWLFLGTEVLLFAGIFLGYTVYRWLYHPTFHAASRHLSLALGGINTVVLITSSFTVALGYHAIKEGKARKCAAYMAFTIACAGVFLLIKYFEYAHKFHEGQLPGRFYTYEGLVAADGSPLPGGNIFFAVYFLGTGLHAFHVIVGASILAWLTRRVIKGKYGPEYYVPVELGALYWHLVDLVWIFLFPLLYLI